MGTHFFEWYFWSRKGKQVNSGVSAARGGENRSVGESRNLGMMEV